MSIFDGIEDLNIIGITKVKIINDLAYSGILVYNLKEKKITNIHFNSTKPIFTKYFSSVLFLNYTDIYLNLLNELEVKPDCYIVNSSGQIHPFYYGAACDLGLKIKSPVIGYTEKLLFGELRKAQNEVNYFEVLFGDRLLGYAIPRLKSKKFYYISVGNNISLNTAKKTFLKMDLTLLNYIKAKLNEFIRLNNKAED